MREQRCRKQSPISSEKSEVKNLGSNIQKTIRKRFRIPKAKIQKKICFWFSERVQNLRLCFHSSVLGF